jgi:glycosyltransferase involved in cell wall biosynthesis
MNKFTVSIHMVTFNHEKYIEKALDGALRQITNFDFEIIIADDCSTDTTQEICVAYQQKYPSKVKLIQRVNNLGAIKNFVDLFKYCNGKYVAICEGDDYWTDPYKLQKQIDLLEQYPSASMSVALIKTLDSNNKETTESPFINDTLPLIYQKGLNKYFHTSTYVIRKESLELALKKYRKLFINDTAICFLLINIGPFVLLNDVVSVYRQTNEGIWTGINQLRKDFQHYQLHRAFRKYHVLKRFCFHLKWEKKFLDKITLEDKNYRQQFTFRKIYVDTLFYSIKAYHKLLRIFRS